MHNIMLDIETLDTGPRSLVTSIGAVAFDPHSKELGEKFYVELVDDMASQQRIGRTVGADTARWWMAQSDAARALFDKVPANPECRVMTAVALQMFSSFVNMNGGRECRMWGNGSDFDNVIVGSLYDDYLTRKPWSFAKNRCYRTIKREFGEDVPCVRQGVHHNGLDDAITQAVHLQEIYACIKRQ